MGFLLVKKNISPAYVAGRFLAHPDTQDPAAPFPGEGWSLGLGDVVGPAQEGWEVKEAGEAWAQLWPLPNCTGEAQRGLFGFFNYRFYFFSPHEKVLIYTVN